MSPRKSQILALVSLVSSAPAFAGGGFTSAADACRQVTRVHAEVLYEERAVYFRSVMLTLVDQQATLLRLLSARMTATDRAMAAWFGALTPAQLQALYGPEGINASPVGRRIRGLAEEILGHAPESDESVLFDVGSLCTRYARRICFETDIETVRSSVQFPGKVYFFFDLVRDPSRPGGIVVRSQFVAEISTPLGRGAAQQKDGLAGAESTLSLPDGRVRLAGIDDVRVGYQYETGLGVVDRTDDLVGFPFRLSREEYVQQQLASVCGGSAGSSSSVATVDRRESMPGIWGACDPTLPPDCDGSRTRGTTAR